MADLITHLCSALLPMALLPRRWRIERHTGLLALGTALPDLTSRVPGLALSWVHRHVAPLPEAILWPWAVTHMPLGMACVCWGIALAFPEKKRAAALGWLLAGCALHLGLDLLQDHHGQGYLLAWPLSYRTTELGWIGSEATVTWAPFLAAATAAAWAVRAGRAWTRSRRAQNPP